jgi:asparagine synthase (glutamine-hydrolysing)
MCGIVGSFPKADTEVISQSVKRLLHRGPDDHRVIETSKGTFGHTRLAIIDVAGGHQPMKNNGDWIAFNGQIYNYQQLRQNLAETFETQSDTEVILKLYAEHGPNCVALLDGMFAIALLDGDDLFLARDPLGIKPLYYAIEDEKLYFASEIKALVNLSSNILEFPPGYWWHSKLGLKQYYRLPEDRLYQPEFPKRPDAQQLSQIQDALRQAVHKRLIADQEVPVGVSLSGGLDSSIVAALARENKDRLDTFVVGTPESTDISASKQVADYLGTRNHIYQYSIDEMLAALPEVIYHLESFDAPLVRSAIPNYFLAKLASQHVRVILTGEGADELYAGYDYLIPVQDPDELDQELKTLTGKLHNTNLQRADRMSMAHGLEGRVPFLDENVVDMSLGLPAAWKLRHHNWPEKALLRKSFSKFLPAEIVDRPKAKFSQGAGSMDMLATYAHEAISDQEFVAERNPTAQISLHSKEELLYFRIFRHTFGDQIPLETIGRTRSITADEMI